MARPYVVGSTQEDLAPVRSDAFFFPLFPQRSDGDSGSRRVPAPVPGEPQAVLPGDAGGTSGAPALPAVCQRRRGGRPPAHGQRSGRSSSDPAGHHAAAVSAPSSPRAGNPSRHPARCPKHLTRHFPPCRSPIWRYHGPEGSAAKIKRGLRALARRLRRHRLQEGVVALGERGTAVLAAVVRPSCHPPGTWGAWCSCPTNPLSLPFPPAGPRALGAQEEAGPGAGGTSGAFHHAVPVRQRHLPALPALPAWR